MNSALIAKLIEAGTPADLVAEVAMELARAHAAQDLIDRRRAKDRERKSVPRNSTETSEIAETPFPLEVSPQTPLPNPSIPESPPLNPPAIFEEKVKAVGACLRQAYPPPPGVSGDQWEAFKGQRKKRLRDRSYALICAKLLKLAEDGWPPGEMIDLATERGWETVFPPRNFGNERSDRDPTTVALERLLGGSNAGAG